MADFGTLPTLNDAGSDTTLQPNTIDSNAKNLQEIGGKIVQAGAAQASDLPALNDAVKTTHARFGVALDGLLDQVDASRSTINDAYDKMQKGRYMPPGIARILSIFGNHDYDMQYQKGRIDQASTNLELANQSTKTLATAAQSAESAATFARQGLESEFNTQSALGANTRADISTKIEQQNQAYLTAQRQVEGMTQDQLAAAMKNPDMLIKNNPNINAGMIESAYRNKVGAQTALEQAQAVLQGTNTENKERNMRLLNESITNHLNLLSTDEFNSEAQQAGKTGYFQKGDLKIPNQMYLAVAQTREAAQIAHAKETADFHTAQVGNEVLTPQIEGTYSRIVNDPQASGYVSPEDKTALQTKYAVAKTLANNTDPNSVMTRYKVLQDVQSQIDAIKQKAIENSPKEAQPGKKQFFESGSINDGESANGLLIASTLDSSSPFNIDKNSSMGVARSQFGPADPYAMGDQTLRTNLLKIRDQANYPLSNLMGPSGGVKGGISVGNITNQKPSDSDLFQKAWNAPITVQGPDGKPMASTVGENIKATTTKAEQEIALHNAIIHLGTDFADRPGLQAFKALLSGGEIAPQFRTPDGHISPQAIFSNLAQKDLSDTTGASRNVDTLIGVLNDPGFRKSFAQYERSVFNTPEHAAYRERLFHNDVATSTISPLVQALRAYQSNTFLDPATGNLTRTPPNAQTHGHPLSQVLGAFLKGSAANAMPDMNRFPMKRPGETNAQADARLKAIRGQ